MSTLKAFVGHSFEEEDDLVVRRFLDYFTTIKNMGIGFSWDHAREAKPKMLADKVLEKIEDKNLFIGICTKKEKVIGHNKLKKKLLRSEQCGNSNDFGWKTSDWIIQEIGLAIGRDMKIILLIEEGLREPGGLQGDLEYIGFSREAPTESFSRILEMIQELISNIKPVEETIAGTPKQTEDKIKKEEAEEAGIDWATPKPEWTRAEYEIAVLHMISKNDKEGEQKIADAYLETEEAKDSANADAWAASREYMHILSSKGGSLSRLETLAKAHSGNSEVQEYLARAYSRFGEDEKAAKAFVNAGEKETDSKREILMFGSAARAYARSSKKSDLNILISRIKERAGEIEDGEIQLLECLIDISEIQKNKTLSLAYMERLLDLKPDDNNARFNLAYGHSNEKREALALFHYLKIPYRNRSAAAWNNMGVSYSELNIGGKSIEAYRISEDKEETLAMSNIANKFLNAGFLMEAQEKCEKAKAFKDYNKNIDDTLYRLKKKIEEEDKKSDEILEEIKPIHEFFVNYGHAATYENISSLPGVWRNDQCQLNITIKDNGFIARGVYEVPSLGLNMLLAGSQASSAETNKYEVFYEGMITGLSVSGTLRRSPAGTGHKTSTLLTDGKDAKPVLMIISDDLSVINVYQESATYESQKFHLIKKLD